MPKTIEMIDLQTHDVKWLIDKQKSGLLIVDNSFQRRYVWTQGNKVALIETILLGYPIPEIYLWAGATDAVSGDTPYSIIDGQQRLGALFQFFGDKFRLTKKDLKFPNGTHAGKLFSELDKGEKSDFWKYPFAVRILSNSVEQPEITSMFLRLNSGTMSLNPQELRNAEFNGKFLELAAELADHPFWKKHDSFKQLDIRRMLDVQFVSGILIFFRLGIEGETTQESLNRAYDFYNEVYRERNADGALFRKLLEDAETIIGGNQVIEEFLRNKTHLYTLLITLYYYASIKESITLAYSAAYLLFVEQYATNEKELAPDRFNVGEYRRLSREGVQKKGNRLRRFEILRGFLDENLSRTRKTRRVKKE